MSTKGYCQDNILNSREERRSQRALYKNNFNLNITQLLVKELRLGFEWRIAKRYSLNFELAYKFNSKDFYESGPLYKDETPYMATNAYTFGFLHKFFFSKVPGRTISLFIESKLFVRYFEYNNLIYWKNTYRNSIGSLKNGFHYVYNLTENFGLRFSGTRVFLDVYAGISLRIQDENVQTVSSCSTYYGDCNRQKLIITQDDLHPFIRTIKVVPSPSLGMRIGMKF